jgi:acyl-coenzyme A synthetase/AMP-(fatty) acid ligase
MTAADAPVLWAGCPESLTLAGLQNDALGLRARVPRGGAVVLRARHAPLVAAALSVLDGWAASVDLMSPEPAVPDPEATVLSDENLIQDGDVIRHDTPVRETTSDPAIATVWRMYTSGTMGAPRRTEHTLDSLSRTVRAGRRRAGVAGALPRRWGYLYPPTRMAGLQVLLQALGTGEELCDATHIDGVGRRMAWLREHDIDALSATPTLWRQILQSQAGPRLRLRQVTLGGEIATQDLLDALHRAYPAARVTHVYATTETGSVFAVSDGRAGFPATYTSPTSKRGLQVRDGILRVRAPWSSAAEPDGLVTTGDLVRIDGDRVHFLGRADGVVNVGGQKVLPEQTEAVLTTHERVAQARVTARPNALSGAVLVADVVLTGSGDLDIAQLTSELRALVSSQLSRAHAPARIAVVDEIPVTSTGKAARR